MILPNSGKSGTLVDITSFASLKQEHEMSDLIPGSPAYKGASMAAARLQRYGVDFDEERILISDAVNRAVGTAVSMIEEEPAPGDMTRPLIEFTAEAVAFGAMTREINHEHEMDVKSISRIKDAIRFIFNDLLDD